MSLHTEWTPVALLSLSEVFEYTLTTFGERQLLTLKEKITSTEKLLTIFPLAGKVESDYSNLLGHEYRSVLVIKELKMIYTIDGDRILIEYLKNTRLDDTTLLLKLL